MNLSDKRKKLFNAYKMRNIPTSLILLIQEQDKEFIKALKERIDVGWYHFKQDHGSGNIEILIDELAGKKLI